MKINFSKSKYCGIIIGVLLIIILSTCIIKNLNDNSNITKNITTNNSSVQTSRNREYIDKETQKFLFGEWEFDKLLGFNPIQKDIANYPYGQDVLKNKIIFQKNLFSSKGINKYPDYQVESTYPVYYIGYVFEKEDKDLFFPANSQIDVRKILNIRKNDMVKMLEITDSEESMIPFGLYIVNNERLILYLDSAIFELKKIK